MQALILVETVSDDFYFFLFTMFDKKTFLFYLSIVFQKENVSSPTSAYSSFTSAPVWDISYERSHFSAVYDC